MEDVEAVMDTANSLRTEVVSGINSSSVVAVVRIWLEALAAGPEGRLWFSLIYAGQTISARPSVGRGIDRCTCSESYPRSAPQYPLTSFM